MKFHELNKKFRMAYKGGETEILRVIEYDGSGSRCSKCRFRKAERHTMTGAIHSWGCRLEYADTMCGIPNNEYSQNNERPDGKQIIYQ